MTMVAERLAVRTRYGVVLGASRPDCLVFSDVPYAADPVGALRFAPPQPPQKWTGVRRPVARNGDEGAQRITTACREYFLGGSIEHPLTLKISTPTIEPAGLPVLVWFHSGGFIAGSAYAPASAGEGFARDGVVHVSVGFRQGIEGYLPFVGAEEAGALNLGLQDQIMALEWIRDEIAGFGGDPERVTLGGYGSGGTSVAYLLESARARGLFQRAAMMSAVPRLLLTRDQGTSLREIVSSILGAQPTAEVLRGLDRDAIFRLEHAVRERIQAAPLEWGWQAILGAVFSGIVGDDLLPTSPLKALSAGETAPVPLLIGSTRHELALFVRERVAAFAGQPDLDPEFLFPDAHLDDELVGTYECHGYADDRVALFNALATDYAFRLPALRYAEQRSAPTWLYQFDWSSPARDPLEGAITGLDVPLWTDDLERAREFPQLAELYGEHPPTHLADAMHGAMVRFVSGNDPGWAAYDPEERMTMCFDEIAVPVPDLHSATRRAWERALIR